MANLRISQLPVASLPQPQLQNNDLIPIARGNTTRHIRGETLKASIIQEVNTNLNNLTTRVNSLLGETTNTINLTFNPTNYSISGDVNSSSITPSLLSQGRPFWTTTGRIGIKTDDPGFDLDVFHNLNLNTAYDIASFRVTNTGVGNFTRLTIGQIANNRFALQVRNQSNVQGHILLNPPLALNNNGNVGIGILDIPSERLHIGGNIRIGDSNTSNYISFHGTTGDSGGTHTFIGERIYEANTERSELLLFKGNDPETATGPDRVRVVGANLVFQTYNSTTNTSGTFETVATSTTPQTRLFINASGDIGIGTTTPQAKLNIVGSGNSLRFTGTSTSNTGGLDFYNSTLYVANIGVGGSTGIITIASDPSNIAANSRIVMSVDGGEIVRATDTNFDVLGNITLGTQANRATLTYTTNTARTYTIPNAGANADFVMTAGNQTIAGTKTFSSAVVLSTAGSTTTQAVRGDRSISAGDGLSGGGNLTADRTLAVDTTVVRTSGNQTIGGTKTFSSAVVLSTAGSTTTQAVRGDRSISAGDGLSGGGNLTADRTLAVDTTVVRTSGNQTIGGNKTFSGTTALGNVTGNILLGTSNTSIRQSTTTWSGNPGAGVGKIEYHSNRWYIVAGSDSTEIVRFRRDGTDRTVIDNNGNFSGNAATATALETTRTIGGVSFNGTANINLPGVNAVGNQNTSGNAATATTLQTARNINGVSFNGSANITLPTVNTSGTQTIAGAKTFENTVTAPTFNATSTTNGGFQGIATDTASLPSFTWTGDLNTGMYKPGNNQIGFTTNGVERILIGSGGGFTVRALALAGSNRDLRVNENGTLTTSTSDRRLKKNITPILGALEKVNNLTGVYFNWINEEENGKAINIGLVAQDVEPIVPELVFKNKDGICGINYSQIGPLLINALKELKQENEMLKSRIEALEAKL